MQRVVTHVTKVRMTRGMCLLLLVVSVATSSQVRAGAYSWVPFNRGDVSVITTAEEDLAIRLELISRAKTSVDVAIFEQAYDENVGKPVISALREAAERGVRVRFINSTVAQMVKDMGKKSAAYLTSPPAKRPVEFYYFGWGARDRNLGPDEAVHEKILIVDGKIVLATGRGHSSAYLKWLDTSVIMRGPLVAQTVAAVNALFEAVKIETDAVRPGKPPEGLPVPKFAPPASMALSVEEQVRHAERLSWLDSPLDSGVATGRARTLHHDFIRQVQALSGDLPNSPFRRYRRLNDPVVNAVLEKLPTAREVRFTTLSVNVHPVLRKALQRAARNGTRVVIQTNGKKANLEPINVPWRTAMADMINLTHSGVEIWKFAPNEDHDMTYLHRKLAIIDDAVIFGSHNLNLSSTTNNDEMSWEIEDAGFAREIREIFDRDLQITSDPVMESELREQLGAAVFWMPLGRLLMGTF